MTSRVPVTVIAMSMLMLASAPSEAQESEPTEPEAVEGAPSAPEETPGPSHGEASAEGELEGGSGEAPLEAAPAEDTPTAPPAEAPLADPPPTEGSEAAEQSPPVDGPLPAVALPSPTPTVAAAVDLGTGRSDPAGTFRHGDLTLRPRAELRFRGELRAGPYTASGTGSDQYFVGSRARLGLELGYEALTAVILLQDARRFGQFGVGTDGGDTTGLHLGYLELRLCCGWLRLGRQEVNFGRQRLVGSLNWSTAGRSFDALRFHGQWGSFHLDALAAMVRMPRSIGYAVEAGDPPVSEDRSVDAEGDYLAGLYATWALMDAFSLDFYVLFRHDGPIEPAAGADPTGAVGRERDIAAPGLRLHGAPLSGLAYDLEAVVQAGRAGGERHLAFAVAGEISYALQVAGRPGLAVGGAYASGGAPGDDVTEFDNFFPTNHMHYGAADLVGLRNVIEGHARVFALPPGLPLRPSLSFYVLGLADPASRWSNAGGRTLGVAPDNEERILGYELDVNLGWAPVSWLKLAGGYSVFFPAAGADALGHTGATHWAYLMVGSVLP